MRTTQHTAEDWYQGFGPPTWSNWALVVVGALAGCAAFSTLRAIRRQTGVLERQTTAMERQVQSARLSAKAARMSAVAFRRSERAWIGADIVSPKSPNFSDDANRLEIWWLAVAFTNRGKTPALIRRIAQKSERVKHGTPLPPDPDYSDALIVDADFQAAPEIPVVPIEQVPVSSMEFAAIRQRTQDLYVYGFVEYTDIHGQAHETRFCFE